MPGASGARQLVAELYTFSRRIGQAGDAAQLHTLIVETIATHVGAQQAALALYDEVAGRLNIVATRGYPTVLVEDLRIAPGAGIIGEVFVSRKPLLVQDAERERSQPRRLRYRTGSFMAVPLFTEGHGLGVLTLADRQDLEPFTRSDLTAVAGAGGAGRAGAGRRAAGRPGAATGPCRRRRSPDRPLQPALLRDPHRGGNPARPPLRPRPRAAGDRRRRLQGAERPARPPGRRPGPPGHGRHAAPFGARVRRLHALRRRGVRHPDAGQQRCCRRCRAPTASGSASSSTGSTRCSIPSDIHPTISVGVAVLAPDNIAQDLISRADRALYVAKAEGKNCVRLATS